MPQFVGLDKSNLRYTDALTYVAIRSFKNNKTHHCFPSYETIGELMGASRDFVIESVKRLTAAGFMSKLTQYHSPNRYYFSSKSRYTKIPPTIFALDLSLYEKAMLIILRQFCEGTPVCLFKDVKWIAEKLGVTYKIVHAQMQALIKKGYVEEIKKGSKRYHYYRLTSHVDWFYVSDMPEKDFKPEEHRLFLT